MPVDDHHALGEHLVGHGVGLLRVLRVIPHEQFDLLPQHASLGVPLLHGEAGPSSMSLPRLACSPVMGPTQATPITCPLSPEQPEKSNTPTTIRNSTRFHRRMGCIGPLFHVR